MRIAQQSSQTKNNNKNIRFFKKKYQPPAFSPPPHKALATNVAINDRAVLLELASVFVQNFINMLNKMV